MTLFLAVCTLAALVFVGVFIVGQLAQLGGSSRLRSLLVNMVGGDSLRLTMLVATVATAGSLYMSEKLHYVPCELCWYQRIFMYPLPIIIGIALWRGDAAIRATTSTLAGLGLIISLYHYQLERFPDQETLSCSVTVPCTTIWFEHFGFITIPFMAATAFAAVLSINYLGAIHGKIRTK